MPEDNGYLKKWIDALEASIKRNFELITTVNEKVQSIDKRLGKLELKVVGIASVIAFAVSKLSTYLPF